jgi:hypothetical protein
MAQFTLLFPPKRLKSLFWGLLVCIRCKEIREFRIETLLSYEMQRGMGKATVLKVPEIGISCNLLVASADITSKVTTEWTQASILPLHM